MNWGILVDDVFLKGFLVGVAASFNAVVFTWIIQTRIMLRKGTVNLTVEQIIGLVVVVAVALLLDRGRRV